MKKVLVAVDMQNDFINGPLRTKVAEYVVRPYVTERIRKAREDDTHVICIMDTHGSNYLSTNEGRLLPVKHCVIGTEGWELNKDIMDALGDSVRRRMENKTKTIRDALKESPYYFDHEENIINNVLLREESGGARISVVCKKQFGSPALVEEVLQCTEGYALHRLYNSRRGNTSDMEIEIMGFRTDVCVISNAMLLKTYFPEANIVVPYMGCMGTSVKQHLAALDIMRSCQIKITGAKEEEQSNLLQQTQK